MTLDSYRRLVWARIMRCWLDGRDDAARRLLRHLDFVKEA